jgi:hypothetical protein
MIDRQNPEAATRVRAGLQPQRCAELPRHWIHDRAPRLKTLARERQRREQIWAWLSLVTLIVCWDASERLGQRVSPPRVRIAHALEEEEASRGTGSGLVADL